MKMKTLRLRFKDKIFQSFFPKKDLITQGQLLEYKNFAFKCFQ